jgi:hypothetical protein
MFLFFLIRDCNNDYIYTLIVPLYPYKYIVYMLNPNSQGSYEFLLLIIRGFQLSEEIYFLPTQDKRESYVIFSSPL